LQYPWYEESQQITSQNATYSASYSERDWQEKKWTLEYPNIPSAICSLPHGEGLPIPESPDGFSLDFDEEEENMPEEMQQPSTSRDLEFFMNGTCDETHRIMQEGLYDLIRILEVSKNKADLLS
jgi:hypothetical protein